MRVRSHYALLTAGIIAGPASEASAGVLGELPAPGFYVSPFRVVIVLIMLLPWLAFCQWVDKDTQFVRPRMNRDLWNSVALGGGIVGLAVWLFLPWESPGLFAAGFGMWLLVTGGACSVYVIMRNGQVDVNSRVFTPRHIQSWLQSLGKKKEGTPVAFERVRLTTRDGTKVPPPTDPTQTDAYVAAQTLLWDSFWRRATEVRMLLGANNVRLAYMIDGAATPRHELLDHEAAEGCMKFIKTLANLDLQEKRKPQKGAFSGALVGPTDTGSTEVEVITSGTTQFEQLVLKIVSQQHRLRIADLGMEEKQQPKFEEVAGLASGLVVVSGPRMTGVTTTLYAALRHHDAFMQNLLTLEREPLMDLENITQNIFDAGKHEASFARQFQTVLRREPDVVMVCDCPDRETAHLAARAAVDGKKIYMGMVARDSFDALKKLLSLAGDTDGVAAALVCITSQRLVRKLCVACRQAYKPDPQLIRKANLPITEDKYLYRPPPEGLVDQKGNPIICQNCRGSGYYGRTGVFEVLEVDDNIRKLIRAGQPVNAIKSQARKAGMLYLQDTAIQKVISGVTSMAEVLRVMRNEEPAKVAV